MIWYDCVQYNLSFHFISILFNSPWLVFSSPIFFATLVCADFLHHGCSVSEFPEADWASRNLDHCGYFLYFFDDSYILLLFSLIAILYLFYNYGSLISFLP